MPKEDNHEEVTTLHAYGNASRSQTDCSYLMLATNEYITEFEKRWTTEEGLNQVSFKTSTGQSLV